MPKCKMCGHALEGGHKHKVMGEDVPYYVCKTCKVKFVQKKDLDKLSKKLDKKINNWVKERHLKVMK